jgi:putative RecB family exonuclease
LGRQDVAAVFRLSPLRVRVFNTCRLRYRYQYVDKLQARLRPSDTAGSLVHTVLCDFFSKVPPGERSEERLVEMFEGRWAALSPRYLRMAEVPELHDRNLDALRRFAQREDLSAQPFRVEAYVQVAIAPDVTLFGRMDRVDEEPDGSLHIVDYKTGAYPGDVDASQLHLYAIMVERKLERTVSRASFWYLDDGSVWTTELTPRDKEEASAGALAAVSEMQREDRFEPTVAPHCAACPYLYACAVREEIAQRRQAEGW